MEEKVYQRQMLKGDLAQVSVYEWSNGHTGRFSKNQLKELFEIELGTSCMTSDILEKMGTSYEDVADDDDAALQAVRDSCPITFVYKETMKKSSPAYHRDDDHETMRIIMIRTTIIRMSALPSKEMMEGAMMACQI
eukprot:jgi/Picre1/33000/NNA_008327.t1